MLTSRGLGTVLGDLAAMGFNARWGVLGAADIGANHQRDRIWIVAKWRGQLSYAQHDRIRRWEQQQEGVEKETGNFSWDSDCNDEQTQFKICGRKNANPSGICSEMAYTKNQRNVRRVGSMGTTQSQHINRRSQSYGSREWWETEPDVGRVADGVAARVDRLKAIGNGQVPLCAAEAWNLLNNFGG